jgi:hypothetical protein
MARNDHAGRYISGPHGLEKEVFKRNPVLRDVISPNERKEVLDSLRGFLDGGGLNVGRELQRLSQQWRRNTDDKISAKEAQIIKRELRDYVAKREKDSRQAPPARSLFRPQHDLVHNDPRTLDPATNPPYRSLPEAGLDDIRPTTTFSDPRAGV